MFTTGNVQQRKQPQLQISLPESYDIGYLPIQQQSKIEFFVENRGDKPVNYTWKYTIFQVTPPNGILLPHTKNKFQVLYTPQEATVVVATIVLETDQDEPKIFKLSAIGKYSYVSCSTDNVNFGEILVGKQVTRELVLKNSSPISAKFKIVSETQGDSKDSCFGVTPSEGQIPAKSSFQIRLMYQPQLYNLVSSSKFKISCDGGNEFSICCTGRALPFDVKFSTKSINFGEVKLQNSASRALTIYNNSQLDTTYQFFIDAGNIFSISENRGILPRNSYKKIIVQFTPRNTVIYHQRVYCIIRNHQLLYVDLIGTCYDLLIRPLPLLQVHLDLFRKRVIEGRLSQIDLKYLDSNVLMKIARKMEQLKQDKSLGGSGGSEQFDIPEATIKQSSVSLHKQLFLQASNNPLISFSEDFLDFGHCENMTISGQKEIEVTNHLNCKLTISWIMQKRQNFNGEYMTVFQVFPESLTLKAGATGRFYFTFRPLKTNYYFFQQMQFFAIRDNNKVSKKTLEDFEKRELKTLKPQLTLFKTLKANQTVQTKLKEDLEHAQVMPPLTGSIKCVGHSFGAGSLSFIPIMQARPSKSIVFAPCRPGQSTYQTVQLSNLSDTPTYYRVTGDVNRIFRVHPKAGLIEGRSFHILTVEFSPKDYKQYNSTVLVHLNNSSGSPLPLQLTGICSQPKVKLQNDGKLYFPPTFTGVYSRQELQIQNLSKLPVNFHLSAPEKFNQEIFFEPSDGIMQANQTLKILVGFIPQAKKQYKIKAVLKVSEVPEPVDTAIGYYKPGSGSQVEQMKEKALRQVDYNIEIFGEGSDGSLKLEKQLLDFEVVKVSEQKKMKVKLKNLSNCTFYTQLNLKPTDPSSSISTSSINNSFHLDFNEGIVAANSQILIGVTFSPVQVMQYDLQLIVSAKDKLPKGTKLSTGWNNSVTKCSLRVIAHGSFPLLKIVDIRNDSISVAALWQNFQISKINQQLAQNLNPDEKNYLNIQNLPYSQAQALQNRLKQYEWNFGYVSAKTNNKPRKIIITVKNFGGTNLDYCFKFPSDNSIEEEIWADPGEPTKEQAYQKAIISKNIFQIKPKQDSLKPNDVRDIELIYTPANISGGREANTNQKHMLQVVLQIKNGKPLLLNLKGMTLGPYEGLLAVKKNHYKLPNTPIGLLVPLKFPIEIQNVGSSKINYKAQIHYQGNEFTEVFTILNPVNSLLPAQRHYLYCLFKPLERKLYNFKVAIQVYDFVKLTQTVDITLEGEGYVRPKAQPSRPTKNLEDIPGQRSLVSEIGSKVFFSIQQIDFNVLKPGQTTHRMIILYNLSKNTSLNFDFPTQNPSQFGKPGLTCGDEFIIEPSQGQIPAGQFIELKITLTSAETPSVYEGQIECNIVWGSKHQERDRMVQTEVSQKSAELNFQKETLFLRIKKSSSFEASQLKQPEENEFKSTSKSLLDNIFENIVGTVLNNPSLEEEINRIYESPVTPVDFIEEDESISINKVQDNCDEIIAPQSGMNHNNYRYLFHNDEFLDMAGLIMENTFFNIVQETTHKENDLLRIAKKFVPVARNYTPQ